MDESFVVGGPVGDSELLLCHGMVCVVGRIRDLILQLSKSSIYSTKPSGAYLSLFSLTLFVSNETRNVFSPAQNALNSSGVTSADRFILAPRR